LQAAKPKHRPKLAKELTPFPSRQNCIKKISSTETKKYATDQINTTKTVKLTNDKSLQTLRTRTPAGNRLLAQAGQDNA